MAEVLKFRRETFVTRTIARPRLVGESFCGVCLRSVRWLVPEEAMFALGVSLREVFRKIEAGELHFVEVGDGFLVVCAGSLELG